LEVSAHKFSNKKLSTGSFYYIPLDVALDSSELLANADDGRERKFGE